MLFVSVRVGSNMGMHNRSILKIIGKTVKYKIDVEIENVRIDLLNKINRNTIMR